MSELSEVIDVQNAPLRFCIGLHRDIKSIGMDIDFLPHPVEFRFRKSDEMHEVIILREDRVYLLVDLNRLGVGH